MNCPKCPNDHVLTETIVVMADHFCDVCDGLQRINLVHRCQACDHDVCSGCYKTEIKKLLAENDLPTELKTIG